MKYPQELAKDYSGINFDVIAKYGCCAFVYLWCLGIEPDNDIEAIKLVQEAIDKNYIEKDCTVKWYDWGKALTGRTIDVEKVKITTISNIKERTPVWYSINGVDGHWVGVENGKIAFNPLKNSLNVKNGKPRQLRKIVVKGMVK